MDAVSSVGSNFGALQSAVAGIDRASQNLEQDAQAIASGSLGGDGLGNVAAALLDMSQQSVLAAISAKAASIVNQTMGSLLDVMA